MFSIIQVIDELGKSGRGEILLKLVQGNKRELEESKSSTTCTRSFVIRGEDIGRKMGSNFRKM